MEWAAFIFIGLAAGLLSGLLGLGGGIVIVPALTALFTEQHFPKEALMQMTTATSLATIAITSLVTIILQSQRKAIQWHLLPWFVPGIMIGAITGIWLGKHTETYALQILFSIFCGFLGITLLFPSLIIIKSLQKPIKKSALLFYSLVIGMISSLLGIGGGLLLIPLLSRLKYSHVQVSATSIVCVFPIALSATLSAMLISTKNSVLPLHTVGFVYWPGAIMIGLASVFSVPWGVFLAHNLPETMIKRLFGLILLWVAWHMFPFM